MMPLKRIIVFFISCLVCYGVLVAPWPGVTQAYRTGFCACGNYLFDKINLLKLAGFEAAVDFSPVPSPDQKLDTTMTIHRLGPQPASAPMNIAALNTGYRPMAFLIALVLSSPIPWRRRIVALLLSLVLVNLFVVVRLLLPMLYLFTTPHFDLLAVGESGAFALKALTLVFFFAPESDYIVPAFIWLLVCFRRSDWNRLFAPRAAACAPDASSGESA